MSRLSRWRVAWEGCVTARCHLPLPSGCRRRARVVAERGRRANPSTWVTLLEQLQRKGYRRVGSPPTGFRYQNPGGKQLRSGDLERIHALKLPPAWSDVYVSPIAGTKLQAIGKDKAGRWQYRYHPSFRQRQENAKYRRLLRFAQALPRMCAAVARDLRRRGLPKEKVPSPAAPIAGSSSAPR